MKELMEVDKEKGFALYDDMGAALAEDFPVGREFEDSFFDLDAPGVEILDESKLEFDKKGEEAEDFSDLELVIEGGDKTNDPVRTYLREMGSVPLLTREGEIELAKRNERGQFSVRKALSRSPLVIREIVQLGEDLRRGTVLVRDVLVLPEFIITDEDFQGQTDELLAKIDEIEKHYRKCLQYRQKMQAVSRNLKPKQHRSLRYGLGRSMVEVSRLIRAIAFSSGIRRMLADKLRCAVDQLKPIEREISRLQRKIEDPQVLRRRIRDRMATLRRHGICARNCGNAASASSNWKRIAGHPPANCGGLCRSSSAANKTPT